MYKTLLVTLDFPPNTGGVANYYFNLVYHLPSDKIVVLRNHMNGFTCPPVPRSTSPSDEVAGGRADVSRQANILDESLNVFKIYSKKFFTRLPIWPKWLPMFRYIWQIIRKEKIKMLWVGQVLPVGTGALVFKKLFSLPFIVSTHGMDITLPQKSKRKSWLLKKIFKNAAYITANSKFTKKEIIKIGMDEDKILVVYPCPSLSNKQQIIDKYNLQNKQILLSVGRLVKRKGFDLVIKALPKVLKEFSNSVYLIVGKGPECSRLKALSLKLNLNNKVIFCGFVPQEELKAYYGLCDIFIMTPQEINGDVEGFGIVYLEAGLFGKPVIGSFSGGVPEAIKDSETGLLIKNPNGIDEISKAIIKLLSNQDLARKLGEKGRERVLREFKWEEQAKKLQSLLSF